MDKAEYHASLRALEDMNRRLIHETSGVGTLLSAYKAETRDLTTLLVRLFKELEPKE